MSLSEKLRGAKLTRPPLWKGPHIQGVTQSLLGSFTVCRERFRLSVIEGWQSPERFESSLEYGHMWHLCEEHYDYAPVLNKYARELAAQHPLSSEDIAKWVRICKIQFPIYEAYWASKPKDTRKLILPEEEFDIAYPVSSLQSFRLRGKIDGILTDSEDGLWLQENKTKGEIDEVALTEQLRWDLQTMFYATVVEQLIIQAKKGSKLYGKELKGVLYNVVRRPLSGGRHSIRQHKPTKSNPAGESLNDYYKRLEGLIQSEPDYFFMRWDVPLYRSDIREFRIQFLDPILTELSNWYDWVTKGDPFRPGNSIHYRLANGVYNPIARGGVTHLDDLINTGSTVGLVRGTRLFKELSDGD